MNSETKDREAVSRAVSHTPGPWFWNQIDPEDPEWELCEVWTKQNPTEEDFDAELICSGGLGIANACLIAAAPELYRELKNLAVAYPTTIGADLGIKRVIAKVEGTDQRSPDLDNSKDSSV